MSDNFTEGAIVTATIVPTYLGRDIAGLILW